MRPLFRQLHAAFHRPTTRVYQVVQACVWGLILLSIVLLVVEALLPEGSPAEKVTRRADRVLLVIFAIELVLRVGTFQPPSLQLFRRPPVRRLRDHVLSRLRYMLRPIMLVDALAVLALFPELRGLRALRLLRLLRTSRVFRYRNPFAILMQALEEHRLLFGLAFTGLAVATTLGGASMYLVEVRTNPGIDSLVDGIWWALVTITTVGFGDITPVTLLGRIIGAVLMVAGMFTLALFAGIVGSSLVRSILSIREEQFRMSDYINHVVVCGWDESTPLLLEALERELDLDETRVVLFDDKERPRELPPDFLWVQGDPSKESELDKVRITHAAGVVVSGKRDTPPQSADARTILITFTIRSWLKRNRKTVAGRLKPVYLIAEILDSENVDHARTAGANEVIETRKIGYGMIAHALRYHGTAAAMSRVLTSGTHNVYIGKIPIPLSGPVPFGDLLLEMQLSKRGGLIVGLRTPSGEERINAEKTYMVEPGTMLLYLAQEPLLEPPG